MCIVQATAYGTKAQITKVISFIGSTPERVRGACPFCSMCGHRIRTWKASPVK